MITRSVSLAFVMLLATHTCAGAGKTPASEAGAGASTLAPITKEVAAGTFERLTGMEGAWTGVSTKGWSEEMTYTTIARGSCVLERSFDAHPNETMLTLYHLDGERLLLTHYCVARNQPRLVATRASADGNVVEFTFLDATGIASREQGHMDRLVMSFGTDAVVKQWYWYADGAESPMERITLTRAAG